MTNHTCSTEGHMPHTPRQLRTTHTRRTQTWLITHRTAVVCSIPVTCCPHCLLRDTCRKASKPGERDKERRKEKERVGKRRRVREEEKRKSGEE
jgi:hypothetical protein